MLLFLFGIISPACLAVAPADAPGPEPDRIVLVTLDGVRLDAASDGVVAPHLFAVWGTGVAFVGATTPSPQTFPATVSLLTGRYPAHHGVRDEFATALGDSLETLAEFLDRREWMTAGFPGDVLAHGRSGLPQGFRRYDVASPGWPDSARADSAAAFLERHRDGPGFVWLGFTVAQPHRPWERSLGAAARDSASYAARVASLDAAVGRFLARLRASGLSEGTLLVVAGTHGEGVPGWRLSGAPAAEDPLGGHGLDLSEDALRVPLVFHWSARWSSRVITDRWVSTVDLVPTLSDVLGETLDAPVDGASLLPSFGGQPAPPRVIYHETDVRRSVGWPLRVAARFSNLKLLRYGDAQAAVDLAGRSGIDPLARGFEAPDEFERLQDAVRSFFGLGEPTDAPLDSRVDEIRRLYGARRLGASGDFLGAGRALDSLTAEGRKGGLLRVERALYLSYSRQEIRAAKYFDVIRDSLPDFIESQAAYFDHLLQFGRYDLAIERFESLKGWAMFDLERLWALGCAYAANRDLRGAHAAFAEAQSVGAAPWPRWRRALERLDEIFGYEVELAADPDNIGALVDMGRVLGDLELYWDAYRQFHKARGVNGIDPEPDYWLGVYLMREGRPRHAAAAFSRSLEKKPDYLPSLFEVGYAQVLAGDANSALESFRRAATVEEAAPGIHYNLACLLARRGETDGALAALWTAVTKGYADLGQVEADPDLDALRADPRFEGVVARLRERSGGVEETAGAKRHE
jgi:tetratricopeptide (TPR) repeat protein